MNKRINELAVEAGWFRSVTSTNYILSQEQAEKFAALIVQDCMNNLLWHGHDAAASQLDWFRRNKFGVTE